MVAVPATYHCSDEQTKRAVVVSAAIQANSKKIASGANKGITFRILRGTERRAEHYRVGTYQIIPTIVRIR